MSIQYRKQGQNIILFGQTYPHRERIKALGGRFNGQEKTWRLPLTDANLESVENLLRPPDPCQNEGTATSMSFAGPADPCDPALRSPSTLSRSPSTLPGRKRSGALGETAQDSEARAPDGLSVQQLMEQVSRAVSQAFSGPVWVIGEVQNLARRPSGLFFELAEGQQQGHQVATTTVRAILWQSTETMIGRMRGDTVVGDVLKDGMRVRCLCQVGLYKERGSLTLHVDDIDPSFTKGALALAREKLRRELRKNGLDQQNKKRILAPFPFRVGLVTAAGSRAHHDFVDQLELGSFPGSVRLEACPMQGEGVPAGVGLALRKLVEQGVDVIVLTRGGGSAADLRWFDAKEVALAVATCPIPVICAIGHQDDVSVAEEIAFMRQKTPTAAAEFVLGVFEQTRTRIEKVAADLAQGLTRRVHDVTELIGGLVERLAIATERNLATRRESLSRSAHRLIAAGEKRIFSHESALRELSQGLFWQGQEGLSQRQATLDRLDKELASRDPKPWMLQGWTQLSSASGPVKSVSEIASGDRLQARLVDGKVWVGVDKIEAVRPRFSHDTRTTQELPKVLESKKSKTARGEPKD